MKKIIALAVADAKNIRRDGTLILMLFGPFLVMVGLRIVVPIATDFLAAEYAFALAEYYPLIVCFMSLIPPMLFGLLFGFLILEERDEEIIAFISVTPLRKTGYLGYKLLAPVLLGFLFYFVVVNFTGLISMRLQFVIPLAGLVALESAIGALFLAAFAANKVEGLALGKVLGVMYLAPFLAWFIESDWLYLAGILPSFWVAKAFFAVPDGAFVYWIYILAGLVSHLGIIAILLKKFINSQR